eukprot:CAMPEP_0117484712 /NCGR_PEP_ID=MMETSP0784-20121206/14595_1 /TAXON_ID=39447 /ORGANISM="" /LENGTH=723 /DNA_ID=CAMNT_0005279285 /DNA_START=93 /DNA_END=2264 /DNA_ORIENTATION=-
MVFRGLVAAILVAAAASAAAPDSPLGKVITLLQEMKTQVEGEAAGDQAAYDKYDCWCKTTDKEKTAVIEATTRTIAELTSFVEEAAAKAGQLKTEIEGLAADIAEDYDALNQATELRNEEKAAFDEENADLTETLAALKKAIEVLSKVQLLQGGASVPTALSMEASGAAKALLQVQDVVQRRLPQFEDVMQRDLFDVLGSIENMVMPSGSKRVGEVFLSRHGAAAFDQNRADPSGLTGAAAGAKSYNSRSGQILGILSEMSDQFGRDLATAQKEEAQALEQFEALKAAKLAEIAAATQQTKQKESTLADLVAKSATAKKDITAAEATLSADQQFMMDMTEGCTTEADEYKARVKVRTEEIAALGEALKILTQDDARELFGKTMSLLQTSSSASVAASVRRARERAGERVAAVARKHKNMALGSLAARVKLDEFAKVKVMMDKMVEELKAQQKQENEKLEFCKKELDTTEDEIKVAQQEKEDLEEKHTSLANLLAVLDEDIAKLQADVAETEISLKAAGEERKAQNQLFQTGVSDQRVTIAILKKALARLEAFYGGLPAAASLAEVRAHQQRVHRALSTAEPPPPKPTDYAKSAGAGNTLSLFRKIIKDAELVEHQLEHSEQRAQSSYAAFARDATAAIEADRAAIAEKEVQRAEAAGAKSETEEALSSNNAALANLVELLKAHHLECDWIMKYFEVRKTARAEEIDAITDAKAILSGASFGSE